MIIYDGIQTRYNIYCNLVNKKPFEFPNYEYISFIDRICADFKNDRGIRILHDRNQDDFNNYIIENGHKYLVKE